MFNSFWTRSTAVDIGTSTRPVTTPDAPGGSEARLGQAGAASRFTIHSKVHSSHPGDHEPPKIDLSIRQSLDALKTSTVETIFLHVSDRTTPFEDTTKAMNDAVKQGRFKQFELSNYTTAKLQKIYRDLRAKWLYQTRRV